MGDWRRCHESLDAAVPALPNLRSLSPTYNPGQHGDYMAVLKAELTKTGSNAPRNIALTGHYGSGKSSVLVEVERQLKAAGTGVVNLSLSSLGIGNGRIPNSADRAFEKTNLIQKEIVKQLLYRRRPSDNPASRFSRLDTFHSGPAYYRAAIISSIVTVFAIILKFPNKVWDSLPPAVWRWLDEQLAGLPAVLIPWLSLVLVFAATFKTAMWAERLFQQRFRLTELVAGPAKVTLSESSSSYFDEYLDEIVYFFQVSKTSVVIFEDLDRFSDPHIFEALRELNLLLNNAEQTGTRPIRFVYAVRDSIFEQLDVDTEIKNEKSPGEDGLVRDMASISEFSRGDTRRLMSTNRTKFFDLVVPMVPFISHRTSRDHIGEELKVVEQSKLPGNTVIDIVATHLTDMRLIKNICNEYEVFCGRILTDDGLKELTPDRLFASVVYKNLYLADYESIRDGASRLDVLYRAYRDWIAHLTNEARTAERRARLKLRRIDGIASRSARLGNRLQRVLVARRAQSGTGENIVVSSGGVTYPWPELVTATFWRAYLQNRDALVIQDPSGYPSNETLPFGKVEVLIGQPLSSDDWSEDDRAEAEDEVRSAVSDQRTLAHASMTDALGQDEKLFPYLGDERSFTNVADELFDGAKLALELLKEGLIDENFTLYVTQFPGQAVSAPAMNFILKAVQPNVSYIDYTFGEENGARTSDIEAVIKSEPIRLFAGKSVYNIQIFDYLLAVNSTELDEPIRRLAHDAPNYLDFLEAYTTSGKESVELVRRLSATWSGIFEYLLTQEPESIREDLLDAALSGVSSKTRYVLNGECRDLMENMLGGMAAVTNPQTKERATEIAAVIERLGIRLDSLSVIAQELRNEVISRSLYPISLPNLRTIVEGSDGLLSLDTMRVGYEEVYWHSIDNISDYIAALDEAHSFTSIANSEYFADVLRELGDKNLNFVEEVARRANADCMLDDPGGLDSSLWPLVAGAHRLSLTASNVAAYIEVHGVDEPISDWLAVAAEINVADDTTPRSPLALALLNSEVLASASKLAIVESLQLGPGSLAATELASNAHSLLPTLVEMGLVEDDSVAYRCLSDDEWATKEALIRVSKQFPTYMVTLSLNADELHKIASQSVPDEVKERMLDELSLFEPELGPKGAIELAAWAARTNRTPKAETIVSLASKGRRGSARPILRLLGSQAPAIDIESMKAALVALEGPYPQLTRPGWDRPKIPISDGVVEVLARLKEEGIVSNYKEIEKKAEFEVSKRRS